MEEREVDAGADEGRRGQAGSTVRERVPAALAGLWARARPSMYERVRGLHRALDELESRAGGLTEATRDAAVRDAHKLAGSLGTYGLMSGSDVAREIERGLEEDPGARVRPGWLRPRVEAIESILDEATVEEKETGGSPPLTPETDPDADHVQGSAAGVARDKTPRSGDAGAAGASDAGSAASGEGGTALARIVARVQKELSSLEGFVADRVREADRHDAKGIWVGDRVDKRPLHAVSTLQDLADLLQRVGMQAPARRCRVLATRLQAPLDRAGVARLADDVLAVQRLTARASGREADPSAIVFVVSADRRWREEVSAALEWVGHPVRGFDDLRRAMKAPKEERFVGLIQDVGGLDGPWDDEGVSDRLQDVAGVVGMAAPDTKRRVIAARSGFDRVLRRDAPGWEFAATMQDLLVLRSGSGGRVLVVDDDETILEAIRVTLSSQGFEVTTLQDPNRFYETLEVSSPELLVTDLDMPGLDGVDLCSALRTDSRWENIPVVFLSSKDDAVNLRRAFDAGADDFLRKPLDPEMLLTRVRGRLARLQSRSATGHVDPVTRLPAGPAFEQELVKRSMSVQRDKRTFTIGVVRLDGAPRLRRDLGNFKVEQEERRLARILSQWVQPPSTVGRREVDRFLVALVGVDMHDAHRDLDEVIAEFGGGQGDAVTVSVGLAQLGVHGDEMYALVDAAEQARRRAEEEGGSRVCISGGMEKGGGVQKVDVLVVDDDPTIGELLLESLSQYGWRVAWEPESERAVARLAGPQRDLVARSILLDVNMPDMDGLTVLRILAERQVVPPARVVMLTVRAREDEVVNALSLGAKDHVAKPFSVPVLASRLKRVLGEA